MLSGIDDVDTVILLNLDCNSLLNFYQTSKSAKSLCNDHFWKLKFNNDYPNFNNEYPKFKALAGKNKLICLGIRKTKVPCSPGMGFNPDKKLLSKY